MTPLSRLEIEGVRVFKAELRKIVDAAKIDRTEVGPACGVSDVRGRQFLGDANVDDVPTLAHLRRLCMAKPQVTGPIADLVARTLTGGMYRAVTGRPRAAEAGEFLAEHTEAELAEAREKSHRFEALADGKVTRMELCAAKDLERVADREVAEARVAFEALAEVG